MKLDLDAHEVLALYRHLLKTTPSIGDEQDIVSIRQRLQDHILDCLSPRKSSPEKEPTEPLDDNIDVVFKHWEESVKKRLAQKESLPETTTENSVFDLMEDYDSNYPKSFKRSRGGRHRKKK